MAEQMGVPTGVEEKEGNHQHLCQNSGGCRAAYAHGRDGTQAEDQQRVQHDVEQKPQYRGDKWGFAVARGSDQPGKHQKSH